MGREQVVVAKFGGSSLADAQQFRKVKEILKSNPARRYVVPSAPGKRSSDDEKVTDLLYQCYGRASEGKGYLSIFKKIKARYQQIIDELGIPVSLEKEFEVIEQAFLSHAGEEYAASRGEYLNGILLAAYLGYEFVDSAEVVRFSKDGEFEPERTNFFLSDRLLKTKSAVIPGFYGADDAGNIHTFTRGGSDVTGAIVARAVKADLYENWTDVSGFLLTDPSIVENPKKIDVMTYAELRELSYRGATVLHEEAVYPVRREGISIHIRNTNQPEENDIAFEHMPSGIDTISVILPHEEYLMKENEIMGSLQRLLQPDKIEVDEDMALVTVVGKGMRSVSGIAARFFSSLGEANVNIKMIDMGSNEINCTIGVSNKDFERAIQALYGALVE